MTTLALQRTGQSSVNILKVILWVLFLGPLIAPLFVATGLPLVADSGQLARDLLSTYICPTPAKSYYLLNQPMAVCARCWGATIGLWAGYILFQANQRIFQHGWQPLRRFLTLAWPMRLLLVVLPFGLWVAEIGGWSSAPLWVLVVNGALAGCGAGLFFCSIWPGLRPRTSQ